MKKNCERIRRTSVSGFTLLELIIALSILSMVIVLIGRGFHLGINAWEKGESETRWTQRLRVLSGLMSQQLKSAYPYMVEIDDEKVILFKGETDSVLFVTTLADSLYGGFKWVRYSFSEETLMYREGLLPDKELTGEISGDDEIMDTNIEEVKFEYYSPEEEEWKESWDFGEDLPGAVRVKISYFQPFFINLPMGPKDKDENEDEVF
jgi:general secretion pathway protein J